MLAGLAPVGAFVVTGASPVCRVPVYLVPEPGVLTPAVFLARAEVLGPVVVFVGDFVGVLVVPVWLVRGVVFLMSATLGSGFLTTGTFLLAIF